MTSVRVLRFVDYRVVTDDDGCRVREIATAAMPRGGGTVAGVPDRLAPRTPAWRLDLVALAPLSRWVSDGEGMVAIGDAVHRFRPGEAIPNGGPDESVLVALTLDPARALGELSAMSAGSRELVGLNWFAVAASPLRVRINDEPWVRLNTYDTARIDLRERPVSRFTLAGLESPSPSEAHAVPTGPAGSATVAAPVVYLVTSSR